MKKSIFILTILTFAMSSCLQQETISTGEGTSTTIITGDNNGGNGGNGGNDGGNDGGNGGNGGNGGVPPYEYEIMMAGDKTNPTVELPWHPGIRKSGNSLGFFFGSTTQAIPYFASDSRLKVRFKALAQPYVPSGSTYCQGRATGQASDAYNYTKLKFTVFLRDIICTNYSNGSCTNSYLGSRYRSKTIGPVDVDSYSEVYNYGSIRNTGNNIEGTAVEIAYVRADSTCQYSRNRNPSSEYGCEAEIKVRNASCWNMVMQVSTDYTQDF